MIDLENDIDLHERDGEIWSQNRFEMVGQVFIHLANRIEISVNFLAYEVPNIG